MNPSRWRSNSLVGVNHAPRREVPLPESARSRASCLRASYRGDVGPRLPVQVFGYLSINRLLTSRSQASPRAFRAWPLAWPSPSGPLGWQRLRRSRAGPEDRFCEAVRNDLRVPLTPEGPARTMSGVPAGSLSHLHGFRRTWRERDGPPGVLAGAAAGYGEDRRRPVTGAAVSGSRRAVGLTPEGRGEAAAPQRRGPRVNLGRLRRVALAALSRCSRPPHAVHG